MRLLGIDEAGRGCCAGPLCVAGAILHKTIEDLTDSKKLTEKKREELFPIIKENADFHIVFKSAKEVDEKGLSTCIKEALKEILKSLPNHDEALFDGNTNFGISNLNTMIKADLKVPVVSASSILAKVSRDRYMKEIAKKYPNYLFEKHKGYVTKKHIELIKKFGYCDEHRRSYKIKALEELRQGSLFE
jgi:ribonuclease HII